MDKVWYSLYDRMLSKKALHQAFKKVKSAKGSPGIDGQTINDFATAVEMNIDHLLVELQEKSYHPQAVLRVEIPKPTGGTRKLGIPTVRDRVIQQALLTIWVVCTVKIWDSPPVKLGTVPILLESLGWGRGCLIALDVEDDAPCHYQLSPAHRR